MSEPTVAQNLIMPLIFSWWTLPAAALISYVLGSVASARIRLAARVLLTLAPIVLMFIAGAIDGCKPFGAIECMLGFGLVLTFWWSGAWLLAVLAGAWARRGFSGRGA